MDGGGGGSRPPRQRRRDGGGSGAGPPGSGAGSPADAAAAARADGGGAGPGAGSLGSGAGSAWAVGGLVVVVVVVVVGLLRLEAACGAMDAVERRAYEAALGKRSVALEACLWESGRTRETREDEAGPTRTRDSVCGMDDLYLRQTRLHVIFNQHHAEPFSCGASATPEVYVVCAEVDRALAREAAAPPAAVAVLAWPDRLFGTQYLFDLVDAAGTPVGHARAVDDARYQIQVDLRDAGPVARRLTVVVALYNRGGHLRQWASALAASAAADKAPDRTVLCVADFASSDVDVAAVLRTTGFQFRVLPMPGKFAKTVGLNACLASIDGPTDQQLVFTTDVDVTLPADFAARVRRFTRPGQQVYAPVVLYENCTWSADPEACWGDGGYGLVAYGLEDAEAAGRYDAARFNYREGFEDTDFLLRLVRLPRLLVRRKEAGMIHRYHARAAWKDEANEGPLRDQPLPRVC